MSPVVAASPRPDSLTLSLQSTGYSLYPDVNLSRACLHMEACILVYPHISLWPQANSTEWAIAIVPLLSHTKGYAMLNLHKLVPRALEYAIL